MPAALIRAVGRASGVGGPHPGCFLFEEAKHLFEFDVDVSIEVDVADAVEDTIVGKHGVVEHSSDRIVLSVIGNASSDDGVVDRIGVEPTLAELCGNQTGLEQLSAGQVQ